MEELNKIKSMNNKINLKFTGVILAWIIILLAIAYFVPFKKIVSSRVNVDNAKSDFANAKLVAGHYEYDFGEIKITGGKVKHSYMLKNEGSDDLEISKVFTSCMCTVATIKTKDGEDYGPFGMSGHGGNNFASIKLTPGEEAELIAEFDPMAHGPDAVGPIQRVVYVKTNTAKEPLGLSFSANVVK